MQTAGVINIVSVGGRPAPLRLGMRSRSRHRRALRPGNGRRARGRMVRSMAEAKYRCGGCCCALRGLRREDHESIRANPLVRADTQGMPIDIPLPEQDKCNVASSHGLRACKGLSPWTPIKYQAVAPIWR